ncbi:hypothetical protein ACTXT7_008099 [Hymenolepis weldensis]
MAYVRLLRTSFGCYSTVVSRFSVAPSYYGSQKRLNRTAAADDDKPLKLTKFLAFSPLLAACATKEIPDIPEIPSIKEVAPALNALGEPTFASLGLNSWWPSGWYQALLETLHVNFDLPWWAAIAAST